MGWFLHDRDLRHEIVKAIQNQIITTLQVHLKDLLACSGLIWDKLDDTYICWIFAFVKLVCDQYSIPHVIFLFDKNICWLEYQVIEIYMLSYKKQ